MDSSEITRRRLCNQGISVPYGPGAPEDVLSSLGALQAQDYHAALWAIGLRLEDAKKRDIEWSIADAKISRTWLMRGTLHFAPSPDVRWMLGLLAPRRAQMRDPLIRSAVSRDLRPGEVGPLVKKAESLFAEALRGNRRLTRREMYSALEEGGIRTTGSLGYHLLFRAAWDGIIGFGAHEGRQPTFELLEERITKARALSREDALAELAARYFAGHGPASLKDFAWWSGLKRPEARAALDLATSRLSSEDLDGTTYYSSRRKAARSGVESAVHLLPAFDEYLVGYADRSAMLADADTQRMLRSGKVPFTHANGIFLPVVVSDGEVVGTWRGKVERDGVAVTARPFGRFDAEQIRGLREAAARYGAFLEKPVSFAR